MTTVPFLSALEELSAVLSAVGVLLAVPAAVAFFVVFFVGREKESAIPFAVWFLGALASTTALALGNPVPLILTLTALIVAMAAALTVPSLYKGWVTSQKNDRAWEESYGHRPPRDQRSR